MPYLSISRLLMKWRSSSHLLWSHMIIQKHQMIHSRLETKQIKQIVKTLPRKKQIIMLMTNFNYPRFAQLQWI